MGEPLYRQCHLRSGNLVYQAWIPAKFAVPGKVVYIGTASGTWTVDSVAGPGQTAAWVDGIRSARIERASSLGRCIR